MHDIPGFRGHSRADLPPEVDGWPDTPPVAQALQRPREPGVYAPLSHYAIIGDMHTAALVSRKGSVDWACFPRFDAPSVFARILSARRGGHWGIRPAAEFRSRHRYEPDTNVLVTRFETEGGVLELTDFMPVAGAGEAVEFREIHRRIRALEGQVDVEVRFRPRFRYASLDPYFRLRRYGVLASDARNEVLTVSADFPWEIERERGEARARFSLSPGESRWAVLRHDDDEVWRVEEYRSDERLAATRSFWRDWVGGLEYTGEYREPVVRSALVLKLLVYAPTGAIVAAPTASLPEEIGGSRNWDYRYSWLRDSTYALFSLYALGKFDELDRYMRYLKKVCRQESEYLQIMYGIGGELSLPETELAHLEGYMGSRPVRIGNAAVDQFQLDVYGEVMDSVHIWRRKHAMTEGMWALCRRLADEVVDHWHRPDLGVWEVRTPPRHFVFSKMMAWVALDRAVRAAEELGLPGDVDRWREVRERIHADVLERGWSEEKGSFVQHYGTDRVDASCLLVGILRFLPHQDPRVRSTVLRIERELAHQPSGLLYRYRSGDGVAGGEGAFCVNTFHLSQALALMGEHERAREVFERVLAYASPVGLLAEEIDPETGRLLGNFPQAFSHIGLINAAHVLARTRPRQPADYPLLEDGDG